MAFMGLPVRIGGMPEMPDFSAMLAKVSSVRLPGGVVGKTSTVLIAICFAVAAISWSVHLWWISLIALVGLFGLCYKILNRLIDFADKNPQAAILEGAEFIAHERLKLGMKDLPEIQASSQPQRPLPQATLTEGGAEAAEPTTES